MDVTESDMEQEPSHGAEESMQPEVSSTQPTQSNPQEEHLNPTMPQLFPLSRHHTPELAQILSIRGSYPGTEDSDDPLLIPPDVLDTIMGWDIDAIFANNTHVRMPYTRSFRTGEATNNTEEPRSVHEFKEFKPRTMRAKETTDASGDGKSKRVNETQAVHGHTSAPATTPEELTPRSVDYQMEEAESNIKVSEDDAFNLAPHNRPHRQSNSRGYRGRGEGYKYNSPRVPYRFPVAKSPQYPPLPPPQRPYGPQKNQWPNLSSPRQPYQGREQQPQDTIRPYMHHGKPPYRGRGKSGFKKYQRNPEQMEQVEEHSPPVEGDDKQSKIEEELPKEEYVFEQKKHCERSHQRKDEQVGTPKEETSKRDESTSTNRYFKTEKSKYYRRNAPETSTRREDVSMQQNVAGGDQHRMETNQTSQFVPQGQYQSPRIPSSYPGYVGQPLANAQQIYSPVYPGYAPFMEQAQQVNPGQPQAPTNTPSTSQEDPAHQDMNQQFYQVPLTREYVMQAEYQHFFNQQRQLFYQMHHQQQQQFMQLQMQQMQQQQQQQQQQQIYYQQQRPLIHQDVPPPNIPVVQGFVPASYSIPPPNQYQQSPQRQQQQQQQQQREPEPTLPEVPIIPCKTEEQSTKSRSKTKKTKSKNTILVDYPHIPQGTIQYIRPNTLSSIASQSTMRNVPLPANVLESYRRPPEPTVLEEVQPESSTPRELTEEEIFKRDNPLAWELSKLPQRFGVVPQTCSNSSDSSNNDPMY